MVFPTVAADQLTWLTTDQMVEVDRVMIEDLHIELIQMMENAGRNLALLTMQLFAPRSVTVFAGSGGNGGGGLVAARHLANRGVQVQVSLTRGPEELRGVPRHQLDIVERMGLEIVDDDVQADVAVDAVIGYSLRGAPTGRSATLIERVNRHEHVVSLDTPSGLDTATGERPGVAVDASATLTLAMPKIGLRERASVGRLFVGDISVPNSVYDAFGPSVSGDLFAASPILEVH